MFIAIIGTRFAGKSTVQKYLIKFKGFIPIQVSRDVSEKVAATSPVLGNVEPVKLTEMISLGPHKGLLR